MCLVDRRVLVALAAVACISSCAGNPVPQQWRPEAAAAQRTPHGGWIVIEREVPAGAASKGRPIVQGELIAVDESALHVLTSDGLQSVPRAAAHRITLTAYRAPAGALVAWAVAGGVSTLSHGGYLLLTAPMWAVAGLVAYSMEKGAGVIHDPAAARRFARFPQGLPPGLDAASLGALSGGSR
jgi:hypothetical protein